MENIKQAQLEMRNNYMNGAPGIIVSGLVWLIAAVFAYSVSPNQAVVVLIIGGMVIFPVSMVVHKLLGFSGSHSKDNPLGGLAMEGTFFMLMCIPIAFILSFQKAEWFFDAMLLIIGGRYLTFNTIYGMRIFWILGALLSIVGFSMFMLKADSYIVAFSGAIIEISFGIFMLIDFYRSKRV